MKPLYTFLSLFFVVLVSSTSIAQPTLTVDNNPRTGNYMYQTPSPTGFNPGFNGANMTWNFSSLSGTGTMIQGNGVDANMAVHGSNFPNATVAIQEANGTETYYYGDTNGQGFYGTVATSGGTTAQLVYSDPQDLIQYPMTYSDSFSDSFTGQFSSSGSSFTRSGTTTVQADGYGTLMTPAGTFTDVLRLKTTMQYSDAIAGQVIVSYQEERWTWYDANSPYPLLTFTNLSANGQSSIFLNYLDATSVGTNDLTALDLELEIAPNPTSDFVNVNFNLEQSATVKITVLNLIGQEMKSIASTRYNEGIQQTRVELSDFPSGTYFMRMEVNGAIVTKKLMIK